MQEESILRIRSRSSDRLRFNFSPVDFCLHGMSSEYNQSIEFKLRNSSKHFSFEKLLNSSFAKGICYSKGGKNRPTDQSNKENEPKNRSFLRDSGRNQGSYLDRKTRVDHVAIRDFDNSCISNQFHGQPPRDPPKKLTTYNGHIFESPCNLKKPNVSRIYEQSTQACLQKSDTSFGDLNSPLSVVNKHKDVSINLMSRINFEHTPTQIY
jgi:hypothetical protein